MPHRKKRLKVILTQPQQPARFSVGDSFSVSVNIIASNISQCVIKLSFDSRILEETTGHPNPCELKTEQGVNLGDWTLRVKRKAREPVFVTIEARANNLIQQTGFAVEVIR